MFPCVRSNTCIPVCCIVNLRMRTHSAALRAAAKIPRECSRRGHSSCTKAARPKKETEKLLIMRSLKHSAAPAPDWQGDLLRTPEASLKTPVGSAARCWNGYSAGGATQAMQDTPSYVGRPSSPSRGATVIGMTAPAFRLDNFLYDYEKEKDPASRMTATPMAVLANDKVRRPFLRDDVS